MVNIAVTYYSSTGNVVAPGYTHAAFSNAGDNRERIEVER
jgi:hypothetical protein